MASLADDALAALATITGKNVMVQNLPFMGRTVIHDGKRCCSRVTGDLPSSPMFEVSMQQNADTLQVSRFFVGSHYHGPVMQIDIEYDGSATYRNIFAKTPGGWGKNCSCGGNWMGQKSGTFFTGYTEAITARHDPSLTMGDMAFRESETFLSELSAFLAAHI